MVRVFAVLACALAAFAVLAGETPPGAGPDFDTEVMAVLTKAGCNAGACHGSAFGRGGFKLSLLGQDPDHDYRTITQARSGRRINWQSPAQSLILRKPLGELDHGGGAPLTEGTPEHAIVRDWLSAGAARGTPPALVRLRLEPADVVLRRTGESCQATLWADFADGTSLDVTRLAAITRQDPDAVLHGGLAEFTAARPGRHLILFRYLSQVVAMSITAPFEPANSLAFANPLRPASKDPAAAHGQTDSGDLEPRSFMDDEIASTLTALHLQPAPAAPDGQLLRRMRLDLTGRLPRTEEVLAYAADTEPDKQARLADRLLLSAESADFWTYRLGQWFQVRPQAMDAAGAAAFRKWLREHLVENTPWNQMAAALLTATGDSHTRGQANFARATSTPRDQAEYVSRLFLGSRLGCANCHNHPLDRWTQDDYHGLAAVFSKLSRGRVVQVTSRGEVTHPRTGEPAVPRIPGQRMITADEEPRQAFADWLTQADNTQFAKSLANRVWQTFFGRGLVEPVDDLRETNPGTHPQLLARLAGDFSGRGHDLRRLMRQLTTSQSYARGAGQTSETDAEELYFAAASSRPLSAEVLLDAIADATGTTELYANVPQGTRAISLLDPALPSPALDLLGRCTLAAPCENAARVSPLVFELELLSGPLLQKKLADADGFLRQAIASGESDMALLERLYLRLFARLPSPAERNYWEQQISRAQVTASDTTAARQSLWEDIAWSLLHSREFLFNQ